MGFKEHRIADPKTTLCDLGAYALDYIIKNNYVSKDSLDAIIFVAQQADHPVPGNSKVVHGNLKLSTRQTAHALKEVHGIKISHTMVANYALTAAA